ncbi:hypothetical protein J6590_104123, partial [Homalodisca vitripennis]
HQHYVNRLYSDSGLFILLTPRLNVQLGDKLRKFELLSDPGLVTATIQSRSLHIVGQLFRYNVGYRSVTWRSPSVGFRTNWNNPADNPQDTTSV